ncbi:hypothetical protein CerSpe_259870 [Prunus speciosa]
MWDFIFQQQHARHNLREWSDGILPVNIRENGVPLQKPHCVRSMQSKHLHFLRYLLCCGLDNLINSSKDENFLIQRGIITTVLSKDIARFFTRLYNDTIRFYLSYAELTKNVNANYKDRWQTILRRGYFNNPWSILSFVAALLILGLIFIQTIYAILAYY